jgi:hypothetical protein
VSIKLNGERLAFVFEAGRVLHVGRNPWKKLGD